MIITRVAATNAFKYGKLEINDIPARGVIAVSGDNESGKSSLGEVICFALFGKTFSLDEGDLEKAIRWGEHNCALTVGFAVEEDEYEVFRFLDEERKLGARLTRKGEEEPLVTGMQQVTDKVVELVGFDFEEFLETFYLAQREIIKPHPHSDALKSIAGLSVLERVGEDLENENDDEGADAEELQQRISEIGAELAELNIEDGFLGQLEGELSNREQGVDKVESARRNLESAADDYREALEEGGGGGGFTTFLKLLMLLLAIAAGVAWFLATQQGASGPGQQIASLLQEKGIEAHMLLLAAGGAGVLFVIFWLLGNSAKARAAKHKPLADALAGRVRKAREIGDAAEGDNGERLERFAERLGAGLATMEEVDEVVEAEQKRLAEEVEREKEKLANLQQAQKDEKARIAQADTLKQEKQGLDAKIAEIAHNAKVREASRMLLKGASEHVVKRFNGDLREFAARTLPLFTGNRYEHLRIEEDLNVRVFSNKKRDFMDLAEISAGTQRQIMLALRLALSRELAATAVKGRQFMFLDEPFAFFDQTRTRDTLKVLLDISDKVTQIWVVNQEFPSDQEFALHLVCEDEDSELVYPAGGATESA